MSFVSQAFIIGGVALDLVGAAVLSHAHNAESTLELREDIGADEGALGEEGEEGAIATHARLLSEKRIGFLVLAFGLLLYLAGLVLESSEGVAVMAGFAVGVAALGFAATALWIKVDSGRVRRQTHEAAVSEEAEISDQ